MLRSKPLPRFPLRTQSRNIFHNPWLTGGLLLVILLALADAVFWHTGILALVGLLIAGFLVYFLPSLIAFSREHRNGLGVLLVNLFFGWTLIGWAGALIWSVWEEKK